MRIAIAVVIACLVGSNRAQAQETKPVPKDSVRVAVPGCTKGYVFTAGARTTDVPGYAEIREGMHLRMNGPKKIMAEIKAHEGSLIEVTGLMKKGQYQEGVGIGGGVRVAPAPGPGTSGLPGNPGGGQAWIDVEGWRPLVGGCPSR
jgi:hypothetical protein